jgi:type IV fimbrial biogenesis protein FimT
MAAFHTDKLVYSYIGGESTMFHQGIAKSIRHNRGITLIELMVTVIVIGILFGVGLPSLTNMMNNSAVNASKDSLVNSIAYARQEALDKAVCAGLSNIANTGWRVWVDQNGDCANAGDNSEIVSVEDITGNNTTISAAVSTINFNPQGQANSAVSLIVGSNEVSTTKTVSVAQAGYTTVN